MVDLDGDHVIAGFTFDSELGVGAPQTLLPAGGEDIALVGYARDDGAYQWHQRLGGTGTDRARGLALDDAGNAWLAATFTGTAYFGPDPLVAGGTDGAAARFDIDGEPLAASHTDTIADDLYAGIAALDDGGAVAAGANTSVHSGFASRLRADGTARWTQVMTSTTEVVPTAVAGAPDGSSVVVGVDDPVTRHHDFAVAFAGAPATSVVVAWLRSTS